MFFLIRLLSVSAPRSAAEIPGASSPPPPAPVSHYLTVVPGISFIVALTAACFSSVLNSITEVFSIQSTTCNLFEKNVCTCEQVYMGTQACVCMCPWRPEANLRHSSSESAICSVCHCPRVHQFSLGDWSVGPDILLLLSQVLGHRDATSLLCFSYGFWVSDSDICAFEASTLPVRTTSSPFFQFLSGIIHNLHMHLCLRCASLPLLSGPCRSACRLTRTGICSSDP